MIAELAAAMTCMTAIKDLAKTLHAGPADTEWRQHISALIDNILDLQSKMLAIQAQHQDIAEVNRQLKQQIETHEQWQSTASRYKLDEPATGIFAYAIKPECQSDEPFHWICPNCFQKKQKSVLSRVGIDYVNHKCHNCTFEMSLEHTEPQY